MKFRLASRFLTRASLLVFAGTTSAFAADFVVDTDINQGPSVVIGTNDDDTITINAIAQSTAADTIQTLLGGNDVVIIGAAGQVVSTSSLAIRR